MSSWLDPHTDPVDWGDARNFILSFPAFTPFQVHSWAVQATGHGPEEGWFPSDATPEEQIMYGLYWLDIGIVGWALSGEYMSLTSALRPMGIVFGSAAATAALPLMINLGAQETGPGLVETHERQGRSLWNAFLLVLRHS